MSTKRMMVTVHFRRKTHRLAWFQLCMNVMASVDYEIMSVAKKLRPEVRRHVLAAKGPTSLTASKERTPIRKSEFYRSYVSRLGDEGCEGELTQSV